MNAATAQIRTDGSLGPALTLSGPNFLIGQALGKLSGNNLFQSFATFNVGSGESATFVTTTPGLANVISRVTGGSASSINGVVRLSSTGATPDFFFINPAGVTFGKGAQVDVPAAFNVSTANYVKFPDGNFYADLNRTSTLSAAPPEAFGFLGTTRASIAVNGGATLTTSSTGTDQPIRIIGGDVAIAGGHVQTDGSEIRVIAVGPDAREVGWTGPLPDVTGNLTLTGGGYLYSVTDFAVAAGDLALAAGNLTIDGSGGGSGGFTGVLSQGAITEPGTSGGIMVKASGALTLRGGAEIKAESFGPGRSGDLNVSATTLSIAQGGVIVTVANASGDAGAINVAARDVAIVGNTTALTGVVSYSQAGTTGNAGNVSIDVQHALSIAPGGRIASDTNGAGHSGNVAVRAGEIAIDAGPSPKITTGITVDADAGTGDAGNVRISTGSLTLVNSGLVSASTRTSGDAGTIEIIADTVSVVGGSGIRASSFSSATGNAGTVTVSARDIVVDGRDKQNTTGIAADARGKKGHAGTVNVTASGTLSVIDSGTIDASTLSSDGGGTVNIDAAMLRITNGATIASDAAGSGNAGGVNVKAHDIFIDGGQSQQSTGLLSSAIFGTGNAGNIKVSVDGTLTIINDGFIDSSTLTPGNAGSISITAGAMVLTSGRIISSSDVSTGNAGTIDVNAGRISLVDGGVIGTSSFASGNAGAISVRANDILIDGRDGSKTTGIVSESGDGSGNAGRVSVTATGTLALSNIGRISSDTFSTGNAGTVSVSAQTLTITSEATIGSSTFTSGHAGAVDVTAHTLSIEGSGTTFLTGIASQAERGSSGNAGSVAVNVADTLSISQFGASISSSTLSKGSAGSVHIVAGTLNADSSVLIGAAAAAGSSGQTGTVTVEASNAISLTNEARISIRNDATVSRPDLITPTLLTVNAPMISLASGAEISAASSGNVAASNVEVGFGPQLLVSNALIATAANEGNGGNLAVRGSGTLILQNGQITTSVTGTRGNGGDIVIAAPVMVMQTGFIQANTAASSASGGNVTVDVGALLPSGSTLFVGGNAPFDFQPGVFGFNVIQAVAPTGVSGDIRILTPALDITGSIASLPAKYLDAGGLGRSPCAIVGGSSLSNVGRGGTLPRLGGLLWIDAIDGPQMLGAAVSPPRPQAPSVASFATLQSSALPCAPGTS